MIHGDLTGPDPDLGLLRGETWATALNWLRRQNSATEIGRHELLGPDLYAVVMEYETLDRSETRFESHREFVDLQCTLHGEEIIDWCPRQALVPDGEMEQDVQFWLPPVVSWTPLVQVPGRFSVFFPADAHRPKVRSNGNRVRKVVIKARLGLVL